MHTLRLDGAAVSALAHALHDRRERVHELVRAAELLGDKRTSASKELIASLRDERAAIDGVIAQLRTPGEGVQRDLFVAPRVEVRA